MHFFSGNTNVVLYSPSKATMASKFLPCLLLKPLSGLVCPSVSRSLIFVVGQGASRFQPEHGQSALRVVAAYHLAVEPHPARATLGTRAAGVTAAEELVARDQFGGYLTCVRLYLLAEGVVGQFPRARYAPAPFPHSPVMATSAMRIVLTTELRASPFSVGTSDFLQRSM